MEAPGVPKAARGGGARTRRSIHGVAAGLVVALVLGAAVPASAEVTQSEIGDVDRDVAQAQAHLAEAQDRLAEEARRLERIHDGLERLTRRMAAQEAAIEGSWEETRDRVARMYMAAGTGHELALLAASPQDAGAQAAYLGALAEREREFVVGLAASRADLGRLSETVRENLDAQQAVVDEATREVAERRAVLDAAEATAAAVRAQWQVEEEERRRIAAEERLRREEEERRRREEEERQRQEALAAIEEAAAAAVTAGWSPGSGVEPWRPLVERYFPDRLVEEALAVMQCESLGNPLVVNPYSGASGLFQQMPIYWPSRAANAGWAGASIFDPEANIAVSAYLVLASEANHPDGAWGHWSCKP